MFTLPAVRGVLLGTPFLSGSSSASAPFPASSAEGREVKGPIRRPTVCTFDSPENQVQTRPQSMDPPSNGASHARVEEVSSRSSQKALSSLSTASPSNGAAAAEGNGGGLSRAPAAASEQALELRSPEEPLEVAAAEAAAEQINAPPSCPVPNFTTTAKRLTLLAPVQPDDSRAAEMRPLLVFLPGMDGTGQSLRPQIEYLYQEGYDIRSVYIPSSDRSSWQELVASLLPLIESEAKLPSAGGTQSKYRSVTLLAESFGSCLALLVAHAAPELISRMVLLNPATNFRANNPVVSVCAATGLLRFFPDPLYETAQNVMLPLMVKRNRVSKTSNKDLLSPIDYVPPACAAWRLNMLNDKGLSESELAQIKAPTLLVAAAKDRVLPSLTEAARLQQHIPNSRRIILPESGHTALLEDGINIVEIMQRNGFTAPEAEPGEVVSKAGQPLLKKPAVEDSIYDELGQILEPWRVLTSPLVSGAENLPNPYETPRRPILFVGNHTLFGLYDSPILVHELSMRGFRLRGLAHPAHWQSGAGPLFARYGNVKATPRAAYNLLKEGADVLLFPGGAREVSKKKGEKYKLLWKTRADFVRMASRLNALIVPFGALGGDDAFDILYDGEEVLKTPVIGPLLKELYERNNVDPSGVYPVTRLPLPPGIDLPSPFPFPNIERIYFHFAPVIDTASYSCKLDQTEECNELYGKVRRSVEESIDHLMQTRENDPERMLAARLLAKASRLLPEFSPRETRT